MLSPNTLKTALGLPVRASYSSEIYDHHNQPVFYSPQLL
jgi:hypothetical protein